MPPLGILFIVTGALLLRQALVGRASNIPDDMRDLATALLSGDTEEVGSVMKRRGDGGASDTGAPSGGYTEIPTPTNPASVARSHALAAKVAELGEGKPYVSGATGPNAYDCSGLVWRACKDLGYYNGGRFTTHMFTRITGGWCRMVVVPVEGDIVLWAGHHMGVCTGSDSMYSARSSTANPNIGTSSISGDATYFGGLPSYWRVL